MPKWASMSFISIYLSGYGGDPATVGGGDAAAGIGIGVGVGYDPGGAGKRAGDPGRGGVSSRRESVDPRGGGNVERDPEPDRMGGAA